MVANITIKNIINFRDFRKTYSGIFSLIMSQYIQQRIPYSFSRDNTDQILYKNFLFSHQLQTNQNSDNSLDKQIRNEQGKVKDYNKYIKSLDEEINYYKQAMITAENLIKSYQNQTTILRDENLRLKNELEQMQFKNNQIERVLVKLFNNKNYMFRKQEEISESGYNKFYNRSDKNQHYFISKDQQQNFNESSTFRRNNDYHHQSIMSYNADNLEEKIDQILMEQYKYEEKIFQLTKKIKYLERLQSNQIKHQQKIKLKTTFYEPFSCKSDLRQEKQSNLKFSSEVNRIYENSKRNENQREQKHLEIKLSSLRQTLEKQFQDFLTKKRVKSKSKCETSIICCKKRNERKQQPRICCKQTSSQKKNTKRTVSLCKSTKKY